MAALIPSCTPADLSIGLELNVAPTAIFDESIDVGSVDSTSCFIYALRDTDISSDVLFPPNSTQSIISTTLKAERLDLSTTDVVTTLDYGVPGDATAGKKYRTRITFTPDQPLDQNTNYQVLLTKELSKLTVFDAERITGAGTGVLLTMGTFTGDEADTYQITITNAGVSNTARYIWTRASDSFSSTIQDAKERFIELDRGVRIKFSTGNFVAGNVYRIRVIPADTLNTMYSWSFSTGDIVLDSPVDERSDSVVNLPINPGTVNLTAIKVISVDPKLGASIIPIPSRAICILGDLRIQPLLCGRSYNDYRIELTDEGTAGAEVAEIDTTDKLISVQIEDGVSTSTQVVDALNLVDDFIDLFEATTLVGDVALDIADATWFNYGEDPIVVTIGFSKTVASETVDKDSVQVELASLIPGVEEPYPRYTVTTDAKNIIVTFDDANLKSNYVVKITAKAGIEATDETALASDFETFFTTAMNPHLATVDDVRRRIGYHIANVPDNTIDQLILQYSLFVQDIARCSIDTTTWRHFARSYVTDMTGLILLDNTDVFAGIMGGGIGKVLGDLEISKKTPYINKSKSLMDRLQCSLYKLEPAVREGQMPLRDCQGLTDHRVRDYMPSASDNIIRGESDTDYPDAGRRWEAAARLPQGTDRIYMWGRWYATKIAPWYIQCPNWTIQYDSRFS